MADIGISRHDSAARYDMADGRCPNCAEWITAEGCNVCGGTGRMLPYFVKEGVRCVTCNEFTRYSSGNRYCGLIDSPLWSPWIHHACEFYACNDEEWRCDQNP